MYMYVCMYVCMCVCVCVCVYIYTHTHTCIHGAQWAKGPAYSLEARGKDATSTQDATSRQATRTPSVPNPFLVKKEEETFKRAVNPFGLVRNPMLGHELTASLDNPCPTLEMMQLSAEYPQGKP